MIASRTDNGSHIVSGRPELDLGQFLAKSVTRGTRNGYAADWRSWVSFIGKPTVSYVEGDVYLDKARSDSEKAVILALFFKERYEVDKMRGRQATCVSAGIRHHFIAALRPVDWFECQMIMSARAACRPSCDEIRESKKDAKSKAMLPVSEDMLMEARARLWVNKTWEWGDIDDRTTYLGLMWGFDQVARVSEFTAAESSSENHCVQVWQLSFVTEPERGGHQRVISGAGLGRAVSEDPGRKVIVAQGRSALQEESDRKKEQRGKRMAG